LIPYFNLSLIHWVNLVLMFRNFYR
jgi:hypothetical protein